MTAYGNRKNANIMKFEHFENSIPLGPIIS